MEQVYYRHGYVKPKNAVDPATARDALEDIRSRKGQLTPDIVLDEARDESHPLHNSFEWDDNIAAEAHRRWQARSLIKAIIVREEKYDCPAFVSVRIESVRSYEPVSVVSVSDVFKNSVLTEYKERIRNLKKETYRLMRYFEQAERFLEKLNSIESDLDKLK